MNKMKVVTLGGGKGQAQILSALRSLPDLAITAIVGNSDSGGKTKVAIEDYGAGNYLGDATRCIAALCPNDAVSRALDYRFQSGSLQGWTPRHVALLALEQLNPGYPDKAMNDMCDWQHLDPDHRVIPVTRECAKLKVQYLNLVNRLEEEGYLDSITQNPLWNPDIYKIKDVLLRPEVGISPAAASAIIEADVCILGPGSLFGSTIATLLPRGMTKAFRESKAKRIFFVNIMTAWGETHGYTAQNFIGRVQQKIGVPFTWIVYNCGEIPKDVLKRYLPEQPVVMKEARLQEGERRFLAGTRFVKGPFATIDSEGHVVHDPVVIKAILRKLLEIPDLLPVDTDPRAVAS